MVTSVNTNAPQLSALSSLQSNRVENNNTQNRINTGKTVNSAKDDAATFAIAQKLLSDQAGRSAVDNSLNRARSVTDVAIAGGSQVSDLLGRARELTVRARDPGLDEGSRQALNTEFQTIRDQINTVVDSANFNGTNAIRGGGGDVSAITNEDGSQNFNIPNSDLRLGGPNVTLSLDADISTLDGAGAAFAQLEESASNVNRSLSQLGAGAGQIDRLQSFNQVLQDTTEVGIGNLVDANLAEERARQTAGQVAEQLSIQTLNIANQQPRSILSLFGG